MSYTPAQVNAWYQAVQFKNGSDAAVASWVAGLNNGTTTPSQVQNFIVTQDTYTLQTVNPMIRLYQAAFSRVPDQVGQQYWVGQYGNGLQTYQQIADGFANSAEFKATYASTGATQLANSAQVTQMYQNILLRAPDAGGLAYWTGKPIGQVLAGISTSPEQVAIIATSITNFQFAEIAGNAATSGSIYQYPGFPGTTYPLTVNPDNIVAVGGFAVINGGVTDQGLQTFQSWDSINGGASGAASVGGATLNVSMSGVTVNPTLSNLANFTIQDVAVGGVANTVGLGGLSTLRNITLNGNGAGSGFTLNAIGGVPAGQVTINGTGAANTLNLLGSSLIGATDNLHLTFNGVTGGGQNITKTGTGSLESISITAAGNNSTLGGLNLGTATSTLGTTTINVSGSANINLGAIADAGGTAKTINASTLQGGLTVTALADSTVTGGAGNDSITGSGGGLNSFTGGAGNDTFDMTAGLANTDSITGGDGTNTLRATYADLAAYVQPATATLSGIQNISLGSTAVPSVLAGGLDLTKFGTINALTLGYGGTSGAGAVQFSAGASTLTLGRTDTTANFLANNDQLTGILTVQDSGAATTDSLTINNVSFNSTTGLARDVFAAQALTLNGFETVNVSTGTQAGAVNRFGAINVTGDAGSAVNLTFTGANAVRTIGAVNNLAGIGSINASGIASNASLTMDVAETGFGTITGSGGNDTLRGQAAASTTINGGAGNDSIFGGVVNDVLVAGDGNDQVTSGGGIDNIDLGNGNDQVFMQGAQLAGPQTTTWNTVVGGAGSDILSITTANADVNASNAQGITGFDILDVQGASGAAAFNVTLSNFVNNSTFTQAIVSNTGVGAITLANAANTLVELDLNAAGVANANVGLTRLVDTGTNALTVRNFTNGAVSYGTITLPNEETVTINTDSTNLVTGAAQTGNITVTNLDAVAGAAGQDLTTLNVNGQSNVTITNILNAVGLTTVNASGLTGTFTANAGSSTVGLTLTSGSGATTFTSGAGADSLTGSNVNDVLNGAAGNDSINGQAGNDSITAGTGADQVTLGSGVDQVTQGVADGIALTNASTAAVAAGTAITYANGVDQVLDFVAGNSGDVLVLQALGVPASAIGQVFAGALAAGTTRLLSGTWSGNVFTVSADGVGPDTIVFQGNGGAFNALTNAVVLKGVNSAQLTATNFGGALTTQIVGTYAGTVLNFTGRIATGYMTFDATTGLITATDPTATITQPVGYAAAAVTTIDANGLNPVPVTGTVTNINVGTNAQNTALTSIRGTAGNDTITFADASRLVAGANVTLNGNGGVDTLAITAAPGVAVNLGDGVNSTLTAISNVSLINGSTAAVTFNNLAGAIAVTNAGAASAATVILNNAAGSSYTSSSTNVDTVTLNNVGQSVTTGTGADIINANVAGAYLGTIAGGGAATLRMTAAGGAYDFTGSTLSGINVLNDNGQNAAFTVSLNVNNVNAINTITLAGGTADTIRLADGVYDFSAKTVTFGTAASILDLDAIGTGNKTLTLDAADINNVGTITGETTVGAITRLNFNDAVNLGSAVRGGGVTNIDTVTMAGANQTLSIDGSGASGPGAAQFTTLTGNGTSNLTALLDADMNFTASTITGFDAIDVSAGTTNRTVVLAPTSIANTAVTVTGANNENLQFTGTYVASNWTLAAGTFDQVALDDGTAAAPAIDLTVTENFLTATLANVLGDASGGVQRFIVNASAPASNISLAAVTTVTNLDNINVFDGTGNNTITGSAADAARALTTISLANGGNDSVVFNNAAMTAGGANGQTVTGFDITNDRVSINLGVNDRSNGAYAADWWNTALGNLANGTVVEVNANNLQATGAAPNAVLAAINALANPLLGAAGAEITIVVYTGAGQAGIYTALENTAAGSTFDQIELVGYVNAANNSLAAANFY